MKIAVIGDIHGNIYALNAVLQDCKNENIDEYVFLGDYVMDGPFPNETLDIVKSTTNYVIMGNKEKFISNYSGEYGNVEQFSITDWTYRKLRTDNIEYIKSMEDKLELNFGDKVFSFSHYPSNYIKHENGIYELANVEKIFENMTCDVEVYGHTHRPLYAKQKDKHVISPGSCGLSLIGDTKAYYGIIDVSNENLTYQQRAVNYDVCIYMNSFAERGLTDDCEIWTKYLKISISTGKNYLIEFLLFAKDLMKKRTTNYNGFVDNETWRLADKLFGEKIL